MRGTLTTLDHAVLVRKQGDTARRAPCCRHSTYVTAQQLGRPVHQTQFRPPSLGALAANLGWSPEYMQARCARCRPCFALLPAVALLHVGAAAAMCHVLASPPLPCFSTRLLPVCQWLVSNALLPVSMSFCRPTIWRQSACLTIRCWRHPPRPRHSSPSPAKTHVWRAQVVWAGSPGGSGACMLPCCAC